ncbi:bifunctional riboflavin kinase/FAD synthetase [Candidatus Pantoea edessiphila]|uniref:Riboflavin biosynthesis protein n=1 Tax=Candidatus Pantoea edessiphila TaxID=2044610 RepID=A0A2P5SY47_9GAMM|nr:bifunctional riboflavin kinase/FAD synthetase [Candidatus Pantoea edessiphila]MBK4775613.1 bifunctional riboflavin kinase/FAD synthetase [Pantoea sp. Edef]PPI87261.1 bifunctional riboflavin kinase/FAD synthetase [Candidatus Pantoea edessiphila]
MNVIRGIHNIRQQHHGCVLTIGNFDGVHKGHQALLFKLREKGIKSKLPIMVMLFEPQTLELFIGKNAPARLTSLRQKLTYLSKLGVDIVLCVRFNHYFSMISPQNFISELLVNKLGIKYLALGNDFRFGARGKGNILLLKKASIKYNFNLDVIDTLYDGNERISSTSIRNALANDNLILAKYLLGRSFIISGRIVHGNSLGHILGFPTANINLNRNVCPVRGIYAVKVQGIFARPLFGVANIGMRPTLKDFCYRLEVHLLDININLYGKYIDVVLLHKIRNEKCFQSLETLKKQISKDIIAAKNFFLNNTNRI